MRGLQQGQFAAKPRGVEGEKDVVEATAPQEEKIVKFFATELSRAFGNNVGDQSLFVKVILAEGIDAYSLLKQKG